ncbi:MAG: outer membrane protein assembly factor BamC [Gammaproteobacteria bacterium]|nr:outer membrane protein assembly factor BamC [Gammaproteobacteria bacterium]
MQRKALPLALMVLAITACSTTKETFYKHQPSGQPLDVPPDLTVLESTETFEIPEIAQVTLKKHVLENGAEVVLKRDGKLRWLEVAVAPEVLWEEVKDFWLSNNVKLAWENEKFGIMETEWLRNYDSEFNLDRFRVRIEAKDKTHSELYLTHRGKQQSFEGGELIEGWVDKYNDPELEVEVLSQMLSFMGLDHERKTELLNEAKKAQAIASLDLKSSEPHILINNDYDHSWKLVVQAIDRAGHVITMKEKAAGWLEVRLVKDGTTADFVPGFALSESKREVLRIKLESENDNTKVYVLDDAGQLDRSQQARDFLRSLNRYL